MKPSLISIAVLILQMSTSSGYSLSKLVFKNPPDVTDAVYDAERDTVLNIITLLKLVPRLRDTLLYDQFEENASGSSEEVSGDPDFSGTRRPFTNSHGYQHLAFDPDDVRHPILFITQEIEQQLKDLLQAQTKEETPKEDKAIH